MAIDNSVILETERLILRHWKPDDAEAAYQLFGDADVMRYVGDGTPHANLDFTRGWLERAAAYNETNGFCRWAVDEKSSGELIGSAGFMYQNGDNEVDLGYYLGRPFWGKGFATEIAMACIKYGFEDLGLGEITATVDVRHQVSQHLLRKLGFEFVRIDVNDDGTVDHYCRLLNPAPKK